MPNKKYLAGRRLEWEIVNYYCSHGVLAIRSAGSRSPIDVIVDNGVNTFFFQCKRYTGKTKPKPSYKFITLRTHAKKFWVTKRKGDKDWEMEEVITTSG